MPVSYAIDGAAGIIRTRCVGKVTYDDVVRHFRTLAEDPACPPRLDVLLDVTELETLPETSQLFPIGMEMDRVRSRVEFGRCAIVAASDEAYRMTRMFEAFAADRFDAIRVFREAGEAQRWLGSNKA